MTYNITDQVGRTVTRRSISVIAGSNIIPVNMQMLPAGVYTLEVKGLNLNQRVKFIKQ